MKVALLADLHFGVKKSDKTFMDSQLRFYKTQLVQELKEKNIDTIIICGDIYDTRPAINVQTENIVLDLFKETLKDFNIHVVIGNHDIFHDDTTDVNSLKALDLLPNVNVYEKPTDVMIGDNKVLMLPWITNYNDFDDIVLNHYKYAFAHLDIVGFDMGGRLSENGVTIKNVISKIDNTYTGHYHNRSHREFVDGQTITYIGSPYQITRIDRGCERGYGVLDLDTNEFCWFDNKVSMRFNKFIYPNVDRDKIKGNVVDIYIPYALQTETKKIYDLVRELDGLFPAYPVNTFNESAPDNMQTDLTINNSNFNLLSMFPNYVEQIKDELPNTIKKEEIITELISLYNIFKGSEA